MNRHDSSEDFLPGALWRRIEETAAHALETGALEPVATREEEVEDGGIPFQVRILDRARRSSPATEVPDPRDGNPTREESEPRDAKNGETEDAGPFLPPDPRLLVAEVGEDHLAVLNKFPVLDHHLLIVTRHFAEQKSALTESDFEALARCMAEYDGLGFYNSGRAAGASQRHKHLQLVPLPLGPGAEWLPIERLMRDAGEGVDSLAALDLRHGFSRLDEPLVSELGALGARRRYGELLHALELDPGRDPYNLLATRGWLMIIPRAREQWRGISVNALGFAGALLVRDREQLGRLCAAGPWEVLRSVALPREDRV